MVCELLAIKLLKEYNTRELIDALSYDFFPLQGASQGSTPTMTWEQRNQPRGGAARVSTLEVAIRASAKRFLAHPLVVQQLEAIWAGTIVFHSAADNLHRPNAARNQMQEMRRRNESSQHLLPPQNLGYGTTQQMTPSPYKQSISPASAPILMRRTVTLYDPRDASLFKLSRLRVPRYRQFFSTCSLAILLVLFVAVLAERTMDITTLEVIFWFWSAGFMLDEVVGFNEQGFSLYIMSFWNTFDVGILLMLIIYYAMRLYGIFLVDVGRKEWNDMAYDVLAANAVLLFPRLFSVLDHYRYFSQLLIAFRLMALDLVAVFVLILIACSGFFVAFTMSFGENEYDAAEVAYRIFQILMGFTPAAWEAWPTYNMLGKALLVFFLIICHFLVVTILITVLTNSFMAIVSNANEEHQFVFAVNTISMVKNDALFSYVAPSNILAWLLTPFRFCLPFRTFIRVNRTTIKITHFPLLFTIYAYEKLFLASSVFEPTDLIDNTARGRKRLVSFQGVTNALFSPNVRLRQESVAGFQKDKALDDVFRLAPRRNPLQGSRKDMERQKHNVVNNWMEQGADASPPQEQDRSVVDRLETRRQARKATLLRERAIRRASGTRSVASDPADFNRKSDFYSNEPQSQVDQATYDMGHTDADGDDEHDEDEHTLDRVASTNRSRISSSPKDNASEEDYFHTPATTKRDTSKLSTSATSSNKRYPGNTLVVPRASSPRRRQHNRQLSTNTILFNPIVDNSSSASPPKSRPMTGTKQSNTSPPKSRQAATNPATQNPSASHSGHRTPRHSIYATNQNQTTVAKTRPTMPGRAGTVPNFSTAVPILHQRQRQIRHRRSSLDMGMSDLGLENGPIVGMVPSSFATQMALATGGLKGLRGDTDRERVEGEAMMGRLMLARMKTLEEGFAEVVREFREMRTAGNSSVDGEGENHRGKGKERVGARRKRGGKEGLVRMRSDFDGTPAVLRETETSIGEEEESQEINERYLTKGGSI